MTSCSVFELIIEKNSIECVSCRLNRNNKFSTKERRSKKKRFSSDMIFILHSKKKKDQYRAHMSIHLIEFFISMYLSSICLALIIYFHYETNHIFCLLSIKKQRSNMCFSRSSKKSKKTFFHRVSTNRIEFSIREKKKIQ